MVGPLGPSDLAEDEELHLTEQQVHLVLGGMNIETAGTLLVTSKYVLQRRFANASQLAPEY